MIMVGGYNNEFVQSIGFAFFVKKGTSVYHLVGWGLHMADHEMILWCFLKEENEM